MRDGDAASQDQINRTDELFKGVDLETHSERLLCRAAEELAAFPSISYDTYGMPAPVGFSLHAYSTKEAPKTYAG